MSNVSMIDGHIDEPKMTDEEIIKALECCVDIIGNMCSECPARRKLSDDFCQEELHGLTLEMIKRYRQQSML